GREPVACCHPRVRCGGTAVKASTSCPTRSFQTAAQSQSWIFTGAAGGAAAAGSARSPWPPQAASATAPPTAAVARTRRRVDPLVTASIAPLLTSDSSPGGVDTPLRPAVWARSGRRASAVLAAPAFGPPRGGPPPGGLPP